MRKHALVIAILGAVLALAPAGRAQSVISAKSGTIHHVDGKASIGGTNLKPTKTGEFPALEQGQTLVTEDAHAEILLTPGVFLRLGERSQLEMVNNKLTDTRVKLIDGAALVEVGEIVEGNRITVQVGDYSASLVKQGLYSFSGSPARVKVLEGRAEVLPLGGEGRATVVKAGRELTAANAVPVKFNKKQHDELYAWSNRRAALVARANVVAANTAGQRGNGFSSRTSASGWVYMPTFGFYTYLPGNGVWASPFGYNYYSPATIYMLYQPAYSNIGMPSASQQASSAAIGTRGGTWEGMGGGGAMNGGGAPASASAGSWGGAASGAAPARSGGGGGGAAPAGGGSGRR